MICHSYLNLSLISRVPRKVYNSVGVCIVFSLELLFKRENNGEQKSEGCGEGVQV